MFCEVNFSCVVYHDSIYNFTLYGRSLFSILSCTFSAFIFPKMLPDLHLNDHLRLRKQHPCGSYEWTVTRLGADIGLECKGCGRRVMLTRRELAKRLKSNLTKHEGEHHESKTDS